MSHHTVYHVTYLMISTCWYLKIILCYNTFLYEKNNIHICITFIMDRLAYQNMTIKNRTMNGEINRFRHPSNTELSQIGNMTSQSNMNTQQNNYQLEKQEKNSFDYNQFISSLNNNIIQDQYLTHLNNKQYLNQRLPTNYTQRIYNPALLNELGQTMNNSVKMETGTRDRQINSSVKSENNIDYPLPKFNYSQINNQYETTTINNSFIGSSNFMTNRQSSTLKNDNDNQIHKIHHIPEQSIEQYNEDCHKILNFRRPISSNQIS
jgi:hypothetical protein